MAERHVDPRAVLDGLKDFQRNTAEWAFDRMFDDVAPSLRFLVADEVGLGKTHVAKGVIAQVIDHLQRSGDERHDIVYICSNRAIARQNLRKLAPRGIEPRDIAGRLTMLPLTELDDGTKGQSGINLIAITPRTSLDFGTGKGMFEERALAYTFLREHWGGRVMDGKPARRIFHHGLRSGDPDARLAKEEKSYRPQIKRTLPDFATVLADVERHRAASDKPTLRTIFDELVAGLAWQPSFPRRLKQAHSEFIREIRQIMATVGIASLRPDLVILDEFQRFKNLLNPEEDNVAAQLAAQLFNYVDPDSGRPTRTLLLSATPYRMYSTADELDSDHYADFLATCGFLLADPARVDWLRERFADLRLALTSSDSLSGAEATCDEIAGELRSVMARTERLAATPDRDGMLQEVEAWAPIEADDLRSYLRFGDLAESVGHHEPTEFWKAGPYLLNFMEKYKLKAALDDAVRDGGLPDGERLDPGPGLLSWRDIENYRSIDPQNGRLRWLMEDLEQHRAFELLWIPPSMRYYETGSVYESPEATSFTKRLIFSGWAVVPKVVSSLVSYEAERKAYSGRGLRYTGTFRNRGGGRLQFRVESRGGEVRLGETGNGRRAASMTSFLFIWPSPTLAQLGDPRNNFGDARPVADVLTEIGARIRDDLGTHIRAAPGDGAVDQRWYWAAPLLMDREANPAAIDLLLSSDGATYWEGAPGAGFRKHHAEARALVEGGEALGRPPADLIEVLAEVALGGPAICALRAVSSATGLDVGSDRALWDAAWIASAFRGFFNSPEVNAVVRSQNDDSHEESTPYWQEVVRHCIDGNLQAVLDEHVHVLREWLGHTSLETEDDQVTAADDITNKLLDALDLRTSSLKVDVPRRDRSGNYRIDEHRLRTRFAVAFGNQRSEDGGEVRMESVSAAFNSPFWPFVLTSTSVGQEGLDFHLWCHAVVHWNLPTNPVDLEQREGRVHRYKGHAVRRNIAATIGPKLEADGLPLDRDTWDELFERATSHRGPGDGEMVPYWVFHDGPARIERYVPLLPFSRDASALPRLRRTLAAYRLAFGQPRQEELIEFLGADRTDEELALEVSRLRIDLTPPTGSHHMA